MELQVLVSTLIDRVSFKVPLRSMLQGVLGTLAAAQPEFKTFTLIRLQPGGGFPAVSRKKRAPPEAQSAAKRAHVM